MFQNMYFKTLIVSLVFLTRSASSKYKCGVDENNARGFYDGEVGFRPCDPDCNLNGSNIWSFDCKPCCRKHDGGLTKGAIAGYTILGVMVTLAIIILIYWKAKQRRQRNINNECTPFCRVRYSPHSIRRTQYVLSSLIMRHSITGDENTTRSDTGSPTVTIDIPIPTSDSSREGAQLSDSKSQSMS